MDLIILELENMLMQGMLLSVFLVNVSKFRLRPGVMVSLFMAIVAGVHLTLIFLYRTPSVRSPISLFLILFIFFIMSEEKRTRKIVLVIISLFLVYVSDFLALVVNGLLNGWDYSQILSLDVTKMVCITMFSLIFFALSMMFTVYWNRLHGKIKHRLLLLLFLLPLSQGMLLAGIYRYNLANLTDHILLYVNLCLIVSLTTNIILFQTINQMVRFVRKEQELEFMKMQDALRYSYYQLATEGAAEMSILKHDIRNQLQTAYALFEQKDIERTKAVELVNEIQVRLNSTDNIICGDNAIINTVLTIKIQEASKLGIRTDVQIREATQIPASDMDLCSIFTNLFDNALEGCQRKIGSDKKIIMVRAGKKAGYFVIRITNSCAEPPKLNQRIGLLTTKKDKKNHGYGFRIIQTLAQKYEGDVTAEYLKEQRVFAVTVHLKLNSEK